MTPNPVIFPGRLSVEKIYLNSGTSKSFVKKYLIDINKQLECSEGYNCKSR